MFRRRSGTRTSISTPCPGLRVHRHIAADAARARAHADHTHAARPLPCSSARQAASVVAESTAESPRRCVSSSTSARASRRSAAPRWSAPPARCGTGASRSHRAGGRAKLDSELHLDSGAHARSLPPASAARRPGRNRPGWWAAAVATAGARCRSLHPPAAGNRPGAAAVGRRLHRSAARLALPPSATGPVRRAVRARSAAPWSPGPPACARRRGSVRRSATPSGESAATTMRTVTAAKISASRTDAGANRDIEIRADANVRWSICACAAFTLRYSASSSARSRLVKAPWTRKRSIEAKVSGSSTESRRRASSEKSSDDCVQPLPQAAFAVLRRLRRRCGRCCGRPRRAGS